jgi:hypothetical protein
VILVRSLRENSRCFAVHESSCEDAVEMGVSEFRRMYCCVYVRICVIRSEEKAAALRFFEFCLWKM